MQRNGQNAGERADAEGPYQDQCINDVRHGAEQFQQAAKYRIGRAVWCQIQGGRKAEQKGQRRAGQSCQSGHLAGLEQQPQPAISTIHPEGEATFRLRAGEQHRKPQIGDQLEKVIAGARYALRQSFWCGFRDDHADRQQTEEQCTAAQPISHAPSSAYAVGLLDRDHYYRRRRSAASCFNISINTV